MGGQGQRLHRFGRGLAGASGSDGAGSLPGSGCDALRRGGAGAGCEPPSPDGSGALLYTGSSSSEPACEAAGGCDAGCCSALWRASRCRRCDAVPGRAGAGPADLAPVSQLGSPCAPCGWVRARMRCVAPGAAPAPRALRLPRLHAPGFDPYPGFPGPARCAAQRAQPSTVSPGPSSGAGRSPGPSPDPSPSLSPVPRPGSRRHSGQCAPALQEGGPVSKAGVCQGERLGRAGGACGDELAGVPCCGPASRRACAG